MSSLYLAAGHGVMTNGSWDPGCVNGQYTEADIVYKIVQAAVPILRSYGLTVYTDDNNNKNITACVAEANDLGVDTYISVHCDWAKAPSGTLPIIYPGSSEGMRIAKNLIAFADSYMGIPNRDIVQRDDWEVADTNMPACIFEAGSIGEDLSKLLDYDNYGVALAYGILNYFGISHGGDVHPDVPKPINPEEGGFDTIYGPNYYLSPGDGPDENIAQFQRDCGLCGYWGTSGPLAIDSLYGSECKHACECIQRYNGLHIDGIYGHDTDLALMREVARIQKALKDRGYKVKVDGATGPNTLQALKQFQKDHGLSEDGICGPDTSRELGIA